MTKWYEIQKASFNDNRDFKHHSYMKVKTGKERLKKLLSGDDNYLYFVIEWSMNPNNPKAEIIQQLTGDELFLRLTHESD